MNRPVGPAVRSIVALAAVLLPPVGLLACGGPDPASVTAEPGQPLPGIDEATLGRFLLGRAAFERLTVPEEGLGPLYNEDRCSGCHDVPDIGGSSRTTIDKATRWDEASGTCDILEALGGDNVQQRATAAFVEATGLGREPFPEGANNRARVLAPPLFGLGLVEAVPDRTLLELADPDDADGDGISGRAGRAPDDRVGRFSGKAGLATIEGFTDTALRFELGLTTPDNPVEETVGGEPLPEGVDPMPEPEIDARGLGLLSDYMRYLAPPAREVPATEAARDSVERGDGLFAEVGCASCHVPLLETGPHDNPALDRKPVPLYSDLLLHDLGPGLAGVCGADASPTEHRTARLWGLRYRDQLLFDGRASSPEEAVQYHGGEGAAARDAFNALDPGERAALLRFLASL